MTAQVIQPTKTYTADFTGCNNRTTFMVILAKSFSVGALHIFEGGLWKGICQRISLLAMGNARVNVRITGLDDAYTKLGSDCDRLIKLLKLANRKNSAFVSEVFIGERGWNI